MKIRALCFLLIATSAAFGQARGAGTAKGSGTVQLGSGSNTPPPTLQSITVNPGSVTVTVGNPQAFTATANFTDGSSQDVTNNPSTAWASSAPAIATITSTGNASCISAGPSQISATFQGVTGNATITCQTSPVVITTSSLPSGTVGATYSQTLAATGGTSPYTWTLQSGSLPGGLSLSSGGVISGTPTASGLFSVIVRATDQAAKFGQQPLSISINPSPLVITTTTLPEGTNGVAYSQSLSATGGTTPYNWAIIQGSLPTGLTLTGNTISGTPSANGLFSFTVQNQDSGTPPQTANQNLSINIQAAGNPLNITTTSIPNGTVGSFYSTTVSASGGTPPYTWSLVPNTGILMTGTTLSNSTTSTVTISGFLATPGTYSFNVQINDSAAHTDTQSLSATITEPWPTVASYPQAYVNAHECDTALTSPDVTETIKISGGTYACSITGIRTAITNAENRRVSSNQSTKLIIDAGCSMNVIGSANLVQLKNNGYTGNKCVWIDSSIPPPRLGVRVGSIAIQSISRNSSGTVTAVTFDPHGFNTNDVVLIDRVPTLFPVSLLCNFNGVQQVTVVNSNTFTYSQAPFCANKVESAAVPQVPPFSEVMGPNTLAQQQANMYTIVQTAGAVSDIVGDFGAHHYVFRGGEVTVSNFATPAPLIVMGPNPPFASSNLGHDNGIIQMYVHGCEGTNAGIPNNYPIFPGKVPCGATEGGLKTLFRMNCTNCWVVETMGDQAIETGVDSHCFGTYDGQGPFKIVNNHCRDASTMIHFGGTQPTFVGLVPTDAEIRNNFLEKDPNVFSISAGSCSLTRQKYGFKNLYELKSAIRHLFDGNELRMQWCDGQTGAAILLNPRACSTGSGCGVSTLIPVNNIKIQYNTIAYTMQMFQTSNRSGPGGSLNVSLPMHHVDVLHNYAYGLAPPMWPLSANNIMLWPNGQFNNNFTCQGSRAATGIVTLSNCVSNQTPADPATGIATSDIILVQNCSDPTFNGNDLVVTNSIATNLGPISYQTSNTTVTSGVTGCLVNNYTGYPAFMNWRHNGIVANNRNGNGIRFSTAGSSLMHPRNESFDDNWVAALGSTVSQGWFCAGQDGNSSQNAGTCWGPPNFNYQLDVQRNALGTGVSSTKYSDWVNGAEQNQGSPVSNKFPTSNPCNGVFNSSCLGLQVDATYLAPDFPVNITGVSVSGNLMTLTFPAGAPYAAGQGLRVMIGNAPTCGVSGAFVIQSVTPSGCSTGFTGGCTGATVNATTANCSNIGSSVLGVAVTDSRVNGNLLGGDWRDLMLNSSSFFKNYATDGTDVGPNPITIDQHLTLPQYAPNSFPQ
jgi:Putative Ig domain/Bacterial Ig-like domain (group 2)